VSGVGKSQTQCLRKAVPTPHMQSSFSGDLLLRSSGTSRYERTRPVRKNAYCRELKMAYGRKGGNLARQKVKMRKRSAEKQPVVLAAFISSYASQGYRYTMKHLQKLQSVWNRWNRVAV
jgi:hypothetical protein